MVEVVRCRSFYKPVGGPNIWSTCKMQVLENDLRFVAENSIVRQFLESKILYGVKKICKKIQGTISRAGLVTFTSCTIVFGASTVLLCTKVTLTYLFHAVKVLTATYTKSYVLCTFRGRLLEQKQCGRFTHSTQRITSPGLIQS
jgi:hypothetical protein